MIRSFYGLVSYKPANRQRKTGLHRLSHGLIHVNLPFDRLPGLGNCLTDCRLFFNFQLL
jgi:hypothetical protein